RLHPAERGGVRAQRRLGQGWADGVTRYLITDNDALADEVIGKIAEVLGRAHKTAEAEGETGEARAILHIAHSFADELSAARADFKRERFITEIIEDR